MEAKKKSVRKAVIYAAIPFVIELFLRILFLRELRPWWDLPNSVTIFLIISVFSIFFQTTLSQVKHLPQDEERQIEYSEVVKRFGNYAFAAGALFGVLVTARTIDATKSGDEYYATLQPFILVVGMTLYFFLIVDTLLQARNHIR